MSKEIKNGPYEEYHQNGQLAVKSFYKDGELDGPHEEYYKNGKLRIKCTCKDGKLDGPYEIYHKSGKLAEKTFYKDDKEITEEEYNRFTQNETTPVKVAAHSRTIKALREKEANQR